MKKIFLISFCLFYASMLLHAQDSILHRVIFIGNAGTINNSQQSIIKSASQQLIENKTTVLFLGDNILPNGYPLNGGDKEATAKKILESQYKSFTTVGAPVYFISGDADWDKGAPDGMQKIKKQWNYINSLQDSLLQMLPVDGCPDPISINVGDSMVIIAFDSEWWLYQFDKSNEDADCNCSTRQEVSDALSELINKNRYKVILLVSHHPFDSYGMHGGHYSLKEHLFPLTDLNKSLFMPLPLIGSLYVFYKNTFATPQDIGHPLYKKMIRQVDVLYPGMPNIIHVSGHEPGMQLIKGKQLQVITGVEGKHRFIKKNKHALYRESDAGFTIADLLPGNSVRFTYYVQHDTTVTAGFTYTQPYTSFKFKEDSAIQEYNEDSISIPVFAQYDSVNNFHRNFFGENYRKEYGAYSTLPVLKISHIKGGLTPTMRGGGMQTHSLRLEDKLGNEYVLRSVEKFPENLLPEVLRATFVKSWLKDAMSAQNPFGALMIPVLSDAVKIPHSNPIIGYVSPDTLLGIYNSQFANTVCLLEEREPMGKSSNTFKMLDKLNKDNNNSIDDTTFFRARLLDLFMGDWDRHEGQWRWINVGNDSAKKYLPMPKDRDQAFCVNEGLLPNIASRKWIQPKIRGFKSYIHATNYSFFNGKYLNGRFLNEWTYEEWMNLTHEFVAALSDSVLEASLQTLPKVIYILSHDEMLAEMKLRRDNISNAMSEYYFSLNKIVDIQCSDKNELIEITDSTKHALTISIYKLSDNGSTKNIYFKKTFDPKVTHEIRLYTGKGNDSIIVNNHHSTIHLRIIGNTGNKNYNIVSAHKSIDVYGKRKSVVIVGKRGRLSKHFSNDSMKTAFVPTNRYNVVLPLVAFGFNIDDGLILGAGIKYVHQGFRKVPYGSVQQIIGAHSFSTQAFSIKYKGEWLHTFNKADFTLSANAMVPINTQNYFGTGNETPITTTGISKRFYLARYNLFTVDPAIRWKNIKGTSFSIGPAFQFYQYDATHNTNRFIETTNLVGTYDSLTITKEKMHGGIALNFISDKRNDIRLPQYGSYISFQVLGYEALNSYSRNYAQFNGEIALFKSVNSKSTIVIAERIGGTVTLGQPAFYQTAFLGGRENLMGYHTNRYSGQHLLYNNLELRIKLADFASYILPGQFGVLGFYDVGRVWQMRDHSTVWHMGYGGGFYFAPAHIIVIRAVVAYSVEGIYPYVLLGFRY